MIYKCPNCDGALVFNEDQKRLICYSCDSSFKPEEIDTQYFPTMTMDFDVYSCTMCGAEIMVNPTEAATYCIYCGQPVIVFDRVSSELQPDYILPFQINKEVAQGCLRYHLKKKFFVPSKFKKVEIETLRGIYVPFWLYDVSYHDTQTFQIKKRTAGGLAEDMVGYYWDAQIDFKNLPINASYALNDKELQLLGAYDLKEMVRFNPGYLSGFYADRYDIDYEQAAGMAVEKAGKIFDRETVEYIERRGYKEVFVASSKQPHATIRRVSYALFPVWFMTCRYKGQPYTLFVNGQTGVAAGNLPIQKLKASLLFWRAFLLTAPVILLAAYVFYLAYVHDQMNFGLAILGLIMYLICMYMGWFMARASLVSIRSGLNFTRSAKMLKYVKERQGLK